MSEVQTVGGLINCLNKHHPDTPVVTAGMGECGFAPIRVSIVRIAELPNVSIATGARWDLAEYLDEPIGAFVAVSVDLNEH